MNIYLINNIFNIYFRQKEKERKNIHLLSLFNKLSRDNLPLFSFIYITYLMSINSASLFYPALVSRFLATIFNINLA